MNESEVEVESDFGGFNVCTNWVEFNFHFVDAII